MFYAVFYRAIQYLTAFIDEDDMVADLFYLFHTVGAEDDAGAVFGEAVDLILDKIGIDRIKAAERFIEDDAVWGRAIPWSQTAASGSSLY